METNHHKPGTHGQHIGENWSRHAIVYQIYPRSFKDTNGDGVGDLNGIIEKLDYLNDGTEKSLGINVIWLNPVYVSPQKDFGYDIADYYAIDPGFGDLGTFDRLIAEAHKRNIKIIMDFVANHTSVEHPWFIASRSSRDNPKRHWYIWQDPKPDGSPPNNWLSVFGGSAWEYDEHTKQYYMHSFLKDQPDLNWRNPEVKEEMLKVVKFWLDRGVDGFRTDAVYHLIKDAKFRDDPPNPKYRPGVDGPYDALLHTYSTGQPELMETTNSLCETLEAHENTFMVSEAYLAIPDMMKLYRACGDGLHAPFNFNLMTLPWSAESFKKFIDEFSMTLQDADIPNYVLGNHDRPRTATRLGEARARIAAMLIFTLRGMPFIYYGEELGMENTDIASALIQDPWGRNVPGFDVGRDPERSPMQWDATPGAGFTAGTPWLPLSSKYKKVNVSSESADPTSMLSFYRRLTHYRTQSAVLCHGSYESRDVHNKDIFSFIRERDESRVFITLNFSDTEQKISCPDLKTGILITTTHMDRAPKTAVSLENLVLRPYEGCIFELQINS